MKSNSDSIKKQLIVSSNREYIVKSVIDNYDIFFDVINSAKVIEGIYKINFTVVNVNDLSDFASGQIIWKPEEDTTGILLSFDDYFSSWNDYLYLFDQYGVNVTWFVFGCWGNRKAFYSIATARNDEVGFHTVNHKGLTNIEHEEFVYETIGILESIKNDGCELVSFAYPYGAWESWMNEKLAETYKFIRGYDKDFHVYKISDYRKRGYFSSKSIDFNKYKSSEYFRNDIANMFMVAKFLGDGNIIPLTTHTISSTDTEWAISPDDLKYLFETAKEFKLKFYRYKDFLN